MALDERVFVGLGANLGDAAATLKHALVALARLPRTRCVAVSSFYRSAPVDAAGPDFINAVAELRTALEPAALLQAMQQIEQGQGRERPYRHAPRTLDLDLLLFGQRVRHAPDPVLPHPRAHLRAFVLAPLIEIAPDLELPGHGALRPLREQIRDQAIERLP